jgi:methylglutaconyl-CoA hydratase
MKAPGSVAAMSALRCELDGGVLRLSLARPAVGTHSTRADRGADGAFTGAGDARAVLLAGDGPSFCAGADLERLRDPHALTFERSAEDGEGLRGLLDAIDGCPAPVVCKVHGHAFGGGVGLVACSDVAVAAADAVFAFSEVRLGVAPAVISPYVLARIGPGAARRYFLTGERFDAATALRLGLVAEVAPDPGEAAERILAALLDGGPDAVRANKRLVLDRPTGAATVRLAAECWTSAEGREGVLAFLERRRPRWRA